MKFSRILKQLVNVPELKRQRLIEQHSKIIFTAGFVSYLQAQIKQVDDSITAKGSGIGKLLPESLRKKSLEVKTQKKANIIAVWESMEAVYVLDTQGISKSDKRVEQVQYEFSKSSSLSLSI